MKMVKSLLLGSAAGLVAMTGAQAADLPVKARPVQYVKICSLYGAGFYYIPGTDTCLKVGGYMREEVNVNAGGSYGVPTPSGGSISGLYLNDRNAFVQDWRTRAGLTLDTRSQTEYGTLRSYFFVSATDDNSGVNSANAVPGNTGGTNGYTRLFSNAGFIQLAGFTIGKTTGFFYFDGNSYSDSSTWWGGNGHFGNGVNVFAYTAQFGNGLSATISLENADANRVGLTNGLVAVAGAANAGATTSIGAGATTVTYGNQSWPDIVGNLRVDQAWGGAQIMGQVHDVRASDVAGLAGTAPGDTTGYAIGGGLKFNLPMLGKGDNVIGQVTYTSGILDELEGNANTLLSVTSGFPFSKVSLGPSWDGVVVCPTPATCGTHLTKGWAVTGGYEHNWNAQWKTSLWGEYGKVQYDAASSAQLGAIAGITAGSSADWSMWAIGSRTVWTPVENLNLDLEVMYNSMQTAFAGTLGAAGPALSDQNWWSGYFRVQRNFWP